MFVLISRKDMFASSHFQHHVSVATFRYFVYMNECIQRCCAKYLQHIYHQYTYHMLIIRDMVSINRHSVIMFKCFFERMMWKSPCSSICKYGTTNNEITFPFKICWSFRVQIFNKIMILVSKARIQNSVSIDIHNTYNSRQ